MDKFIFTKKELSAHFGRDWRTIRKTLLRWGLKQWLEECNISWRKFAKMKDLPPEICKKIKQKIADNSN